jgi:hypothetical protein
VYHNDLEEFVAEGLPYLARDGEAKVVGSLIVDLRSAAMFMEDSDDEPLIDLLPVLGHYKNMKGFLVRCGEFDCECVDCQSSLNGLEENLNILFALSKNIKLQH